MATTPASPPAEDRQALASGTRFGELEIVRALGTGGFGIVYLAIDHALEREVAIKEFMPAQLAQRGADDHVSIRSSSNVSTFEIGRRSFVNEARLLAKFDHRSLLKVYRFWEANGTAYMAMPYLQGQTLGRFRKQLGHAPDEAWLKQLLLPLLDALQLLHAEGVFHRDVAPDNIWISATDAPPVLLDFGAARREIGDRTQSFTAILKPSYAPIEQYAESNAVRQGPWTDIYALGAVLYHLLTGSAPPPATARTLADDCQPLAERNTPELAAYSKPFLRLIDWALAVRPADRPQSIAAFRAALVGDVPAPVRHTAWVQPTQASANPYAATVVLDRSGAQPVVTPMPELASVADAPAAAQLAPVAVAVASAKRPMPWMAGAVLAGLALMGALYYVLQPSPSKSGDDLPVAGMAAASEVAALASAPASAMPAVASFPPAGLPSAGPEAVQQPSPALGAAPAAAKTAGLLPKSAANGAPAVFPPVQRVKEAAKPNPQARVPAPLSPAEPTASPAPAASAPAAEAEDRFAVCARRVFLAKDWCLARECKKPANAGHPECVRLRDLRQEREGQP